MSLLNCSTLANWRSARTDDTRRRRWCPFRSCACSTEWTALLAERAFFEEYPTYITLHVTAGNAARLAACKGWMEVRPGRGDRALPPPMLSLRSRLSSQHVPRP